MPLQIGTDEAGYGPNLGPLTIGGTCWRVGDANCDLYKILTAIVDSKPNPKSSKRKILTIADSKVVYSSSASIARLEEPVLAILFALHGKIPGNWLELVEMIWPAGEPGKTLSEFWMDAAAIPIPVKANPEVVQEIGIRFLNECERKGVELLSVACRAVFAPEFNECVEHFGNKATLLSNMTLQIASGLLKTNDRSEDVKAVCDKHGGRSKYSDLIEKHLTNEFVWTHEESTARSAYSWQSGEASITMEFKSKGESFLPTALASMVAKYTREVAMEMWNQYWKKHLPKLKPTKGYPLDAKRFKSDISGVQKKLGIPDHSIWRCR